MNERVSVEPVLSVVIPLYDEAANVRPLLKQLYQVLETLGDPFEVILVDDGSRDETYGEIQSVLPQYLDLKAIRLRRNFGQSAAMCAGVDHALGQVVITMDGDLQSDPHDIPRFVEQIHAGFDLAVGWRKERYDRLWTRKIPSWIANRLIGLLTGMRIRDNGCGLKAFKARLIKSAPLYADRHRFLPSILSASAERTIQLEVNHHPRKFGRSKYGLSRVHKVLLDLIVVSGFSNVSRQPMRYLGTLGLTISTFGLMITMMGFAGLLEPVSALMIGTMMITSGIIFGFWGILCERLMFDGSDLARARPSFEKKIPSIASLSVGR